jgi:hypothetical protein
LNNTPIFIVDSSLERITFFQAVKNIKLGLTGFAKDDKLSYNDIIHISHDCHPFSDVPDTPESHILSAYKNPLIKYTVYAYKFTMCCIMFYTWHSVGPFFHLDIFLQLCYYSVEMDALSNPPFPQ